MSKKRVSQVNKEEDAKRKAFWEAIQALEKEHSMQLGCFLQYSAQGILPVLGAKLVEKVTKEQDGDKTI
jgi:hypothetical protein